MKPEKTPEYFEQEVFRAEDSELAKHRITQCKMDKHQFRKISQNEIACNLCPTVLIVDAVHLTDYLE